MSDDVDEGPIWLITQGMVALWANLAIGVVQCMTRLSIFWGASQKKLPSQTQYRSVKAKLNERSRACWENIGFPITRETGLKMYITYNLTVLREEGGGGGGGEN